MMNLKKEARGRPCMVRLPGCNHNVDTVVLTHYNMSGYSGMGMKPDDFVFGAWACSTCHDFVDGRQKYEGGRDIVRLAHAEGVLRTQAMLKKEGIVSW